MYDLSVEEARNAPPPFPRVPQSLAKPGDATRSCRAHDPTNLVWRAGGLRGPWPSSAGSAGALPDTFLGPLLSGLRGPRQVVGRVESAPTLLNACGSCHTAAARGGRTPRPGAPRRCRPAAGGRTALRRPADGPRAGRLGEPTAAGQERTLARLEAVRRGARVVPQHEPAPQELALHGSTVPRNRGSSGAMNPTSANRRRLASSSVSPNARRSCSSCESNPSRQTRSWICARRPASSRRPL